MKIWSPKFFGYVGMRELEWGEFEMIVFYLSSFQIVIFQILVYQKNGLQEFNITCVFTPLQCLYAVRKCNKKVKGERS